MANRDFLNYKIAAVRNEVPRIKKKLTAVQQAVDTFEAEVEALGVKVDNLVGFIDAFENNMKNKHSKVVAKLEAEIAKLEKQLMKSGVSAPTSDTTVSKVTTIAIFDAILSAITSWSKDGDQASDVEAASQTVIFPCV